MQNHHRKGCLFTNKQNKRCTMRKGEGLNTEINLQLNCVHTHLMLVDLMCFTAKIKKFVTN